MLQWKYFISLVNNMQFFVWVCWNSFMQFFAYIAVTRLFDYIQYYWFCIYRPGWYIYLLVTLYYMRVWIPKRWVTNINTHSYLYTITPIGILRKQQTTTTTWIKHKINQQKTERWLVICFMFYKHIDTHDIEVDSKDNLWCECKHKTKLNQKSTHQRKSNK